MKIIETIFYYFFIYLYILKGKYFFFILKKNFIFLLIKNIEIKFKKI